MALKKCRECRQKVSTEAKACPHCGVPNPIPPPSEANWGTGLMIGIGFLFFMIIVGALADGDTEAEKSTQSSNPSAPAGPSLPQELLYVWSASNVRSGPSTEHAVVRTLQPGGVRVFTGDGSWRAVARGRDTIGWIATSLLKDKPPTRPSGHASRPSPASASRSRYESELRGRVSFDGSQFIIANLESVDWTNCELEINGGIIRSGYKLTAARFEGNEVYTVGSLQFAKPDGERFNPYSVKPQNMSVYCDQGNMHLTWN